MHSDRIVDARIASRMSALGQVGNFGVLTRIAHGSMAEVLLVRAPGRPEPSVLKRVLPEHRHSSVHSELLRKEAAIMDCLEHSSIPRKLSSGSIDGLYYLEIEWIPGVPLDILLQRMGPLDAHAVASVGVQLAGALSHIHRAIGPKGRSLRLVHRDVSPSNIIIDDSGRAVLIDMGVAKVGSSPTTTAGGLKGKVAYVAPEQVRGYPVDARTDLFSLGVVLYEALTGTNPFQRGTREETLDAVTKTLPAPLPRSAGGLAPIVEKLLQKDPEKRFLDASEVERALQPLARFEGLKKTIKRSLKAQRDTFGDSIYDASGSDASGRPLANSVPPSLTIETTGGGELQLEDDRESRELSLELDVAPSESERSLGAEPISIDSSHQQRIRTAPGRAPAKTPAVVERPSGSSAALNIFGLGLVLLGLIGAGAYFAIASADEPDLENNPPPVEPLVRQEAGTDVVITTVPAGAVVQRGDRSLGAAPLHFRSEPGDVELRVSADGFQTRLVHLRVEDALLSHTVRLLPELDMTNRPGVASVRLDVPGRVEIGGEDFGELPLIDVPVPLGRVPALVHSAGETRILWMGVSEDEPTLLNVRWHTLEEWE